MFRIQKILLVLVAAGVLHGQTTQLDLHFQSRDVDFSTANATKPFKSGTTFPSVCAVGEMFFKIDGPAGANLYGCTALNSWSLESTSGGGVGGGMVSQLGDFAVTRTSATVLTVGANCSPSTPCQVRFENVVYAVLVGPATLTISAGSVPAFIYVSSAGALTCASASDTLVGSGCTLVTGSAFPSDSVPLFTWTATTGTWDALGGTDDRAVLGTQVNLPGAGVNLTHAIGKDTFSLDTGFLSVTGNTFWAQLAAANLFSAGAKQTCQPSATTAGCNITAGTLPSAPVAGDIAHTAGGIMADWDGGAWQYKLSTASLTPTNHGVYVSDGNPNSTTVTAAGALDTVFQGQGATADPSFIVVPSCSTGSSALTYNTTTHAYGCNSITRSGSCSIATLGLCDPASFVTFLDDFLTGNSSLTYGSGTPVVNSGLPWSIVGTASEVTFPNTDDSLTGVYGVVKISVNNDSTGLHLGISHQALNATTFDVKFRAKIDSATNVDFFVGFNDGSNNGAFSPNFIGIAFRDAAGDTNWVCATNSANTATRTAMGLAPDTNLHDFEVKSTVAGTVVCTIDGVHSATVSTNVPTVALAPTLSMRSAAAAAKNAWFDFAEGWIAVTR